MCRNLNFEYHQGFSEEGLPPGSTVLWCGGGIIEQHTVKKYTICNTHPGFLPLVRGLDALKWAIYEGLPIGVTSHILGDELDAGRMIDRQLVPIRHNDTFHAVAQRQYEMEVEMLVDAIDKTEAAATMLTAESPLRRRMPHTLETRLLARFQALVDQVSIERNA